MTEVRSSRSEMPGGYDRYHERSRSRGEREPRADRYGRAALKDERGIRREEKQEGGEMKDMHGGRQGGGGGRQGGGFGGDRHEGGGGGGYRDRGAGGGRGFDQGSRGGRGGAGGGGGGGFGGGMKVSNYQEGSTNQLQSNHFRFAAINTTGQIYIYKIEFGSENREIKFQALKSVDAQLTPIFGKYMSYSNYIFTATRYDDSIQLTGAFEGTTVPISITPFQSFSLNDQTADLRKKNLDSIMDFVNKVVKRSLYDQDYKQIGRLPKFFNHNEKRDLNHFGLIVWPGYTCQVKCLNDGIFLNIDTSTKFLQQMTVLDRINQLLDDRYSKKDISELLTPKWDDSKSQQSGQSDVDARRLVVITQYNSASYQIEEILWDETPLTVKFDYKQKDESSSGYKKLNLNLKEYMELRYKIKLAPYELKQPVLRLSQRGQDVYIIPSRCHEASLPANFTRDANKMRDLRGEMITEPAQRYERIGSLIENFSKSGFLAEWQMKVNAAFAQIRAKQLFHAKVLDPRGSARTWEEYEGKRFQHTQPLQLAKNSWAVVYSNKDFEFANTLYDQMGRACGIFGIKVEEPQWVEAPSGKPADMIAAIKSDVNPANTKIIVVIIGNPADKKTVKGFLDKGGVVSQFITAGKLRNAKIGVFSNLLKQMNAKLKQDLYRINLPCFKNTMLIGVDVIMNGRNKLVGCCATVTPNLTQCLTKLYKQRPAEFTAEERKELRGKKLKEEQDLRTTVDRTVILKGFIDDAMKTYNKNNGVLPEQIVMYRDGMGGPTLTKCVIDYEVKQITELLETKVPGYRPKILYCLVDRNIQHRLFAPSQGQDKLNPGPGTVVDTALVEVQGDTIFDFYLIPHKATVATAQPVLYKAVYNTSQMTKDQFETSTYHLCYNYFNFAGPIKVPMVCMYAHKIATYAQENKLMPNENLANALHFL